MDMTIHAPVAGRIPPQSNRTKRAQQAATPPRSGAWWNAIAATLLLLSIGGGAYLASNGGFGFGGGGGGDEGRFAAQIVSPEASPEAAEVIGTVDFQADGVCQAEPLTEDEVFDIVMNPLNGFAQRGIGLASAGTPEPLMEARWNGSGQRPSDSPDPDYAERNTLHQATEYEGASVNAFVTEYYECLQSGTNFQVWGLIMPYAVQDRILLNFPVLRSEEQIREHISVVGPQAYSDSEFSLGHDYYFEQGYTLQGNPVPLSLWVNVNAAYGYPGVMPDAVILSGVSLVDESGEVVAAVNYDGRPTFLQPDTPGVPETLEIAYFGETNTWYIVSTYSLKG